jgi:hypothetical protein
MAADGTNALMDAIENQVKLPGGSAPLDQYNRSYAYPGDGTVVGVYINLSGRQPGRSWVSNTELPQIADGGCSVVTILYSPKTNHVTDAMCNFDLRPPPPR